MIRYNGYVIGKGGYWLKADGDPYNPLNLPPFTMRFEFYGTDASFDPTQYGWIAGTWTAVGGSVWDWTYENANWTDGRSSVLAYRNPATATTVRLPAARHFNVLGGNTTGVTNMAYLFNSNRYIESIALFDTSSVTDFSYFCAGHSQGCLLSAISLFNTSSAVNVTSMFEGCINLTTVPLFNTSIVTNMAAMFRNCRSITTVPLFNTSNVTDVRYMFYNCYNVESGALALYQQMSTQANPPSRYSRCFTSCGESTVTGSAELAQIPSDWK